MKIKIILTGLLALAMASCNNWRQGNGDMYYKIVDDKNGQTIEEDNFIDITFTEATENGIPVAGSHILDQPTLMFSEHPRFQGDLFSALALLSEGDSAIVKVNIDSAVKRIGFIKPAGAKGRYLVYHIRINKVISRNGLNDNAYNSKIKNYQHEFDESSRQAEPAKLKKYIAALTVKPLFTPSGLGYIILAAGSGKPGKTGDTLVLNYTASYLSGKAFETNVRSVAKSKGIYNPLIKYTPLKQKLNGDTPMSGFDEALGTFPAGTKVKLIIPSRLAYGAGGGRKVPPYTPLVCELEILKILPIHKQ